MILTTKTSIASTAAAPSVDLTNPTETIADELKVFPKVLSGSTTILSGTDTVFTLDEYTYKNEGVKIETPTAEQQVLLDVDKDQIKWSFWVSGSLMEGNTFIPIDDRALQTEAVEDFTQVTDATTFVNNVTENGYLEATKSTVTVDGVKKNQLTIKFSKWLDGRTIYVEPYRIGPDHRATEDYVQATILNAVTPEIIDVYWLNQNKEKVTSTGFETTVTLCVEAIGLRNKSMNLSLHDTETFENTIDWNGDTQKIITVTDYKTLVPYQVQEANFQVPLLDIKELFVKVASTDQPTLTTDNKAPLKLSSITQITRLFFANKRYSQLDGSSYFEEVTSARLGNLVYLVAECTNMDGEALIFSIKESTSKLVAANEKLPILEHVEDEFATFINYTNQLLFPKNRTTNVSGSLTAQVNENFASVAINFQELWSQQYQAWDTILNNLTPSQTELFLEAQLASVTTPTITQGTNILTLKSAGTVVQNIYHTGHLSKVNYQEGIAKKVNYIYHAADGKTHDLGTFDIVWAQKWKNGSRKTKGEGWEKVRASGVDRWYQYDGEPGVNKTPIVTIFSGTSTNKDFEYNKNGLYFRFSENSQSREYFNPERLAAIIGSIINTGYDDVVTNGSVGLDATGAESVTHYNGNNIDFKYLRKDKKRPFVDFVDGELVDRLLSDNIQLDIARQNILINTFYKFGFARNDENSNDRCFAYKLFNGEKLDRCYSDAGHKNHLHLAGFVAQYKL